MFLFQPPKVILILIFLKYSYCYFILLLIISSNLHFYSHWVSMKRNYSTLFSRIYLRILTYSQDECLPPENMFILNIYVCVWYLSQNPRYFLYQSNHHAVGVATVHCSSKLEVGVTIMF